MVSVAQTFRDQKSTGSSPNHGQISRNSSKKSNTSLLIHPGRNNDLITIN